MFASRFTHTRVVMFACMFMGTIIVIKRVSPLQEDIEGDADARVVEVTVALDQQDAARVSRLSGLKVIARFGGKA